MGRIEWIPIAELPEEMKDGRQVLLWEVRAMSASWDTYGFYEGGGQWLVGVADGAELVCENPTYFAEMNAPGDT